MSDESQRELKVVKEQEGADGSREQAEASGDAVLQPGKLLRIATMTRELLEEVRQTTLDEAGRARLQTVHQSTVEELHEVLSEDLREELRELAPPLEGTASAAEIRVAQAQLLGWLEGLFHGIQAALWAQQVQARSALEEMRRRGLPPGAAHPHGQPPARPESGRQDPNAPPGQYL